MNLFDNFYDPPDGFGPVPFWWWVGEPLTRERLGWQLEQLRAKGVRNAIVSYSHNAKGDTELGDPPLFSEAWWDLFRWVVAECKAHGMQIGFQDYTLINPILQKIGRETPEMQGFGSLRQTSRLVEGSTTVRLTLEENSDLVAAWAFPFAGGTSRADEAIDLTAKLDRSCLDWHAPTGTWQVVLISIVPNSFDPTHPLAGQKAIEKLYAVFEKECPGELGKTITILFQDELDFFNHRGSGFPVWSARIAEIFTKRKGYPLTEWLPALWHDLGPMTAKVRIDYNDICVQLLEENYFRPIYEWCVARGVLLGNDNSGRGRIAEGQHFYGDAFRTMRWFGAPGNDDAGPVRGHAFSGFKINSSIAHLYQRPRVWNEAFHSSGWGFTPAQIVAGFNEDALYGATLFNLHGLYYSTYGSWWEWAAPDFHFRQPYWEHANALNDYVKRLSWLLSQGVHRCDVAILYPITTIEAGLFGDEAERHAFGLGRHLFDAGIDFDFIDFQSLERAVVKDSELQVSSERYRVLIFPMMAAVRWSTLEKTKEFAKSGGIIIGFGCLPFASDRAGSADSELDELVREIWSAKSAVFISENYDRVQQWIDQKIPRDFISSKPNVLSLHRLITDREIYFVFNRSDEIQETEVAFRAVGKVEKWDAWSGARSPIPFHSQTLQHTRLALRLEPREAQVIVFDPKQIATQISVEAATTTRTVLELDGAWEFELIPTLDNQFGDFRRPPSEERIGAEARRFRHQEEGPETADAFLPDFDDSSWAEVTVSFGPRFWKRGPVASDDFLQSDFQAISLSPGEGWEPYSFSLRWGIEEDAFLKNPYAGPHGLKMFIPDDCIDLGDQPEGGIYYLWTSVYSSKNQTVPMVIGSRSSFSAWLNHELVIEQSEALPPGHYAPWNLPHYECVPHEKMVVLLAGHNPLLLKFVIPSGQRMRAFVAFDPPSETPPPLHLRWFQKTDSIHFDYRPEQTQHAAWYRCIAPPGLKAMDILVKGALRVWVDGIERETQPFLDGAFRVELSTPILEKTSLALRMEPPADSYEGDSLPDPIRFQCGMGRAPLEDWSHLGLGTYSGGAIYRKSFWLSEMAAADRTLTLDLGKVSVSARVCLNGLLIGTCVAPPWRVALEGAARPGENQLEVVVMNSLANHYSVGISTPYAWPEQTGGGWIGPARILVRGALVPDLLFPAACSKQ